MDGLIPNREEHGILAASHLGKLVAFGLMWSVGALLELGDRAKMEQYMFEKCKLDLPEIQEGSGDTIFEFVVDSNGMFFSVVFSC